MAISRVSRSGLGFNGRFDRRQPGEDLLAKVKIDSADHEMFLAAAAATGTGVDRWITAASRRQALADAAVRGDPARGSCPFR